MIACRRHNIFEHALSMAINGITKKLNVYSHVEKINTFVNMENIEIDERAFKNQLEAYKNYLDWSSNFFNASSYFYYDEHLSNIEQYILKLPIWPGVQPCVTWHEKFGITFNDWNRCHHIPSDFSTLLNLDNLRQLLELGTPLVTKETVEFYQNHASPDWPTVSCPEDFHKLPAKIKNEMQGHENFKVAHLISAQPSSARQFLQYNSEAYQNAKVAIQRMQELDIIVSPPPIKKHTLAEKLSLISNKDQCLDLYNSWIQNHPEIGAAISQQDLDLQIEQERSFWTPFIYPEVSSSTRPSNEVLGYQNGSNL